MTCVCETVYSLYKLPHDNVHEPHPAISIVALAAAQRDKFSKELPNAVSLTTAAQQDIACRTLTPFSIDCSGL